MKPTRTILTALLIASMTALPTRAADVPKAATRPNVLVIISDDQGYSDFGFTGNAVVKTPNLDRLAGESAVFRNFVVASACSPSRAAVLTGREHLGTGVWGVPPRANLRRDEVLAPAFFQRAGYRTLHVGKSGCTRTLESQPWHRGWDDAFLIDGGYLHRDPIITHKSGSGKVEGWTADILTDRALEFIRTAGDVPWFMTVAHIIPHLPWVCDERFSMPFRDQGLSPELAACYGSIAQLDDAVGRLLAGLKQVGQDSRTIVIFVSDNGMTDKDPASKPLSPEDWKVRNVHHLRGHKATIWENGIRVPLLIRWPGTISPGDRSQFGCAEDILPTLLDLTAVPETPPQHLPFSGRSLRPALEHPAAPDDHPGAFRMAMAFEGAPRAPTGIIPDPRALRYEDHHLSLRGPRFKFHALPGGTTMLIDLAADPGETTDVSATFPDTARELAQECHRRWDAIISGGRVFKMPTILVSGPSTADRPADASIVPGSAAQVITGRVRVVQQTAQGFAHPGDGVQYALEVQAPGRYRVMVHGQDLDVCGPLSLHLAGVVLRPVKSVPTAISFGVTALQAGNTSLEITTGVVSPIVKTATIKYIALTPVASER